jgi:diguanylate cyclase (GGDEF)-like protein/PAS domain S-box-containing protein
VFEQDLELRYTYVQQPSFGFSPEQVLGKTDCDLFEPETAAKFDTLKRCVIETSTPFRKEIGVSALGRPIQYFDISIAPRKDDIGNITGVLCAAINIDEQFQARERERQQKNVYHALSEINDAIIHQENEGALLTKVCQIAVECGVMSHASIGIPNETGKLIPAAHFGKFTDPSHSLVVSVNPDVQEGQGPSVIAYRENRVFIINDVLSNEMVLPWRERALKDGTNALAVYPIQRSGKPYAVMSIYSDKKDAFNNEIVKLFHSMSLNISLALDHYDHEAARRKAEQALQESDHRLRLAQQAAHMGAFDWDFHTNLVKSSTEIEVLYGFSEGEFDGTYASWLMRVHPDDRSNAEQQVQEALRTGRMAGKWRVALKDGTLRWISSRGQVFYDENGRPLRMIGINIDITQQKLAEEANSLAAKIYQDSSEAMMVLDENHYIIMVNQAFTEITGHEAADIIGTKPSFLRTGHDDAFYDAMWAQIDAVGRFRGEVWHKKKSGELFAVQNTTNKVTSDEGDSPRYVVLLSDITEKKRSADLIWFQANFDSLTGLPNRLFFRNRLEHEIINSKRSNLPLAVMFLDLDGFKDVNDTLGHDMGDVLLKEAADRLRHCVRESDTVARLGGDEFTIILTELHVSRNVDRVAHQILHALSEPAGVLHVVDWITLGRLPWKDLQGYDINGMINSTHDVLDMDFAVFVGGHGDVGSKQDVRRYLGYLEALYGEVRDGMLAGMDLRTLQRSIHLEKYRDLKMHREWLPLNIEGVYRTLADQSYLLMRPDVKQPSSK